MTAPEASDGYLSSEFPSFGDHPTATTATDRRNDLHFSTSPSHQHQQNTTTLPTRLSEAATVLNNHNHTVVASNSNNNHRRQQHQHNLFSEADEETPDLSFVGNTAAAAGPRSQPTRHLPERDEATADDDESSAPTGRASVVVEFRRSRSDVNATNTTAADRYRVASRDQSAAERGGGGTASPSDTDVNDESDRGELTNGGAFMHSPSRDSRPANLARGAASSSRNQTNTNNNTINPLQSPGRGDHENAMLQSTGTSNQEGRETAAEQGLGVGGTAGEASSSTANAASQPQGSAGTTTMTNSATVSPTTAAPPTNEAAAALAAQSEEHRRVAMEATERALAEGATTRQAIVAGVAAAAALGRGASTSTPPPQSGAGQAATSGGATNTNGASPVVNANAVNGPPGVAAVVGNEKRPRVPNTAIITRPHVMYDGTGAHGNVHERPLKVRQAVLLDSEWMIGSGCCPRPRECLAPQALLSTRCTIVENCGKYYDDDEDCCRCIVVDRPKLLFGLLCAADALTLGCPVGCCYHGFGTAICGCWSRWIVRRRYRIEGFGWSDFLMYLCCVSCATAQIQYEIRHNQTYNFPQSNNGAAPQHPIAGGGLSGPEDVEMR